VKFEFIKEKDWYPAEDPSMFQVSAYTREVKDKFERDLTLLTDQVKGAFNVFEGIPLYDYTTDPAAPTLVFPSDVDNPSPTVADAMRLYVRQAGVTRVQGFGNMTEVINGRVVLFSIYHWQEGTI